MLTRRRFAALLLSTSLLATPPAHPYSVLSHEEIVDMAWRDTILPMLHARFPGITPDDIRAAHAYAYGGSVIQDIGYYPFGSRYFSDLLHYVRPEDFVNALIRDSTTPDEYAFALGALAHYCGDTVGHPAINRATALENPRLEQKYGSSVTYAQQPTAHLRTEFGFDVVEVAQGHYLQENYRDFIGFQVSKPLLERAFRETYGIAMSSVIAHPDLAISTYRHAVYAIIPGMTKIAFVNYKDQIQRAAPGIDKRRFIYRLNRTEYERSFGNDYTHLSAGAHIIAFFLKLMPKTGPFKALKPTIPDPRQQDIYLRSINSTVDQYKLYLAQIHAAPAPLPPPTSQDAAATLAAASKLKKDATRDARNAAKATDPEDKARKARAAQQAQQLAGRVNADASKEKEEAATIAAGGAPPQERGALPPGSPITAPTTPRLPSVDLDTGQPSIAGDYNLADDTYAQLLAELVKPATPVEPALAANIQLFFSKPVPYTGPALTPREAEKQSSQDLQIKTNLAMLQSSAHAGTP